MEYVDLIIPTRGRAAKLARTLASIPMLAAGKRVHVIVVFDGDAATAGRFMDAEMIERVVVTEKHIGSVAARNRITAEAQDAVLMATDDVTFAKGSIDAAVRAFEEHFPDGDGVVGFTQTNHKSFSPTGVCLVGQKFLRRYPGQKLYYPGYFHFACQEIERLARPLGKLWVEPEAKLFHYHPSTGHGVVDKTHQEARVHRAKDLALSRERKTKGIVWGQA